MAKYFGTDGIRGYANREPITPHTIIKIAQAFGVFLKKKYPHPTVVIGKDTRVSGYIIENALSAGLQSVGVNIFLLGPIPTPGVAYLTKKLQTNAGIVISASHNPYHDNGIKFFNSDGFKLSDEEEAHIEQLIDQEDFNHNLVSSHDIGFAKRIDDAIDQYAEMLSKFLVKNLKLKNKKVVIDCANGASYKVAPKIFAALDIDCTAINTSPNGFNINENCGALHTEDLQAKVLSTHADVGFAFDGDADRLVVVDEQGCRIDGDQIIALCALELQREEKLKNNGICATVMNNKGLDKAMTEANIHIVRTGVGDRELSAAMRKYNYSFGGEPSGHLIFLDASTTGDGILAALKILEIMVLKNQPISTLAKIVTKYPQITKNIPVTHKPELAFLQKTSQEIQKYEKLLGNEGRIFLRYSGTEPVARITAEGPEQKVLEDIVDNVAHIFLDEITKTTVHN